MPRITFNTAYTEMPCFDHDVVRRWIVAVASSFSKSVGELSYLFCNDEKILEVNLQFLQHDYYTDIITFDYSSRRRIAGDMVISLDTVRSNAEMLGKSFDDELMRVVIHGVLHLVGINDKGPGEREVMEHHEDVALGVLREMQAARGM